MSDARIVYTVQRFDEIGMVRAMEYEHHDKVRLWRFPDE